MNREQTIKILAVLRSAYPHFYRDTTEQDALDAINLWAAMFVEEPYEIVASAVKAVISGDKKGFPPHIGAVKDQIEKIAPKNALPGSIGIDYDLLTWYQERNEKLHAAGVPTLVEARVQGIPYAKWAAMCDAAGV